MHWSTSPLLAEFIRHSRLGVVTDMDGTISHLVERPDEARITPRSRELLQALQPHLALIAVISGRAARDVRRIVDLPGVEMIGNHGMEWWRDGQIVIAPEALAYRPALLAAAETIRAQHIPGLFIEDKGVSVSFHYRHTPDPAATADRLAALLPEIADGLSLFRGSMIFELRPPVGINKGTAFRQLVEQHELDAAVYLGDDTTDLDAVRMARHLRESGACYALGLGVESDHIPPTLHDQADLLLSGVQDVEAFMAWLLSAVSASST